ncbi:hypothetical protein HQO42_15155 [Rhodococcus fascians]|nr:hypothetical protein [Rhodococcus fascians]MBY4237793.1 hypothetical protein [Rhodococcus fascians]MBY4253996.1 hypothetical protein [Rhodococcus fascians]MBY4269133.1 hypothetical protein [Rhodococcus fascians]
MDEAEVRAELKRLAGERAELAARIAELDARRMEVVRAGFDLKLSASSMVADAGLSQQRLSQIMRGGRT